MYYSYHNKWVCMKTEQEKVIEQRLDYKKRQNKIFKDVSDVGILIDLFLSKLKNIKGTEDNQLFNDEEDHLFFIKKPLIKIKDNISEIDIQIDMFNSVLRISIPSNLNTSDFKNEIIKEYLPVVMASNIASIKECYNWFLCSASEEKVEELKKEIDAIKKGKTSKD